MKMEDVNETRREEMLKEAIPANIKKTMNADKINEVIKSASSKKSTEMTQEDYSKLLLIDNLPSKYLKYSEDTKIYGRALDIKQLKKLSNMTPANASTIIDDILRGTLKGIAFEDILISDKLYLILWLRANTYPESGYSVPFMCPECENQATYDFKVDSIGINYIREDVVFEEPLELSNGDFIVFKYPTIKDEQRVIKFKESVKKSFAKYDSDTLSLTMVIDTINGEKKSVMEMHDYVSDTKIYSQIKGYAGDFDFGISDVLSITCNKCGGSTQTGLSFREDFFIPTYRFGKSSRNGI